MRLDKERNLANEVFGTFCEKHGIAREVVDAEDNITRLGILDRRVQLIRKMGPRLLDELASSGKTVQPKDLGAERTYVLNTQTPLNGVNPYLCVRLPPSRTLR